MYTDKAEKAILFNWLQRFGSRFQTGFILTDPSAPDDPVVFINEAFSDYYGLSICRSDWAELTIHAR